MMRNQGWPPPRGILLAEDDWLVPVVFGLDAGSRAAAESYAVSHNNLTMSGGDYTDLDMSRLWNPAEYAALLEDLAGDEQVPVTVDTSAMDSLLTMLRRPEGGFAPNLAPGVSYDTVSPEDVQKAQEYLAQRHEREAQYVDVICPHCHETFFLSRGDL